MKPFRSDRRSLALLLIAAAVLFSGASSGIFGLCGPFTDVSDAVFCPFVLEIFYLGITTGTTPTTYDPASNVSRLQMAAFLSRSVDATLKRGSRRAALGQFWTPQSTKAAVLGTSTTSPVPAMILSDGTDLWVQWASGISRYRASEGHYQGEAEVSGLPTDTSSCLLVVMCEVFYSATAFGSPVLGIFDPKTNSNRSGGISSLLRSMTFDGTRIVAA